MKQLDFYSEEKGRIEESLNKLDMQAPEIAAILRKHVKFEDRPPHATEERVPKPQRTEEDKPKREPWGPGAGLPEKDL